MRGFFTNPPKASYVTLNIIKSCTSCLFYRIVCCKIKDNRYFWREKKKKRRKNRNRRGNYRCSFNLEFIMCTHPTPPLLATICQRHLYKLHDEESELDAISNFPACFLFYMRLSIVKDRRVRRVIALCK